MRRNSPVIIQKTEDENKKVEIQKQLKNAELKLGSIRNEDAKLKESIISSNRTIISNNTKIEKLKLSIENAEQKLVDLKSSIEKETKKLNEIKKFSLISQKEAESKLELINTECINKRSSAENDLSSLKNSIIESQQIIANLNEVITESKSTIANLFEQKETLESTLENLKLQINTNKNTNLSLTNELNNLNILVDVFKKEVETLQLREKDLQSSIEEKESTLGAVDPIRVQLDEERQQLNHDKEEFLAVVARVQRQEQKNKEDEKIIRAKYKKIGIPFN